METAFAHICCNLHRALLILPSHFGVICCIYSKSEFTSLFLGKISRFLSIRMIIFYYGGLFLMEIIPTESLFRETFAVIHRRNESFILAEDVEIFFISTKISQPARSFSTVESL